MKLVITSITYDPMGFIDTLIGKNWKNKLYLISIPYHRYSEDSYNLGDYVEVDSNFNIIRLDRCCYCYYCYSDSEQ